MQISIKRRLLFLFLFLIVLNFIDLNLKGDVLVNNFEDEVKIHPPQVGEELLYEVSYGFIPIGTIRLQVLENIEKNKIELHTVKCFIDSYNLPFVNLHYVMYSELDQNLWSHYFWFGNTSDPKSTWFVEYDFDYSKKNIQAKHGNMQSKKIHLNFKDSISNLYQDGLSLFYFARQNINSNQNHSLPTYMNEKKFKTYINYFGQNSESKIDAINYPIATKYFNGNIEYKGIYGLTGNFEGWFSRDNAAIPIKAKMKVLIGSVNIELIKWQRKNWTPPKI